MMAIPRRLFIGSLAFMTFIGVYYYYRSQYDNNLLGYPFINKISELCPCKETKIEVFMTVIDTGRTGNKLYEFFSLCGIAWSRGHTPVIKLSMSNALSQLFDISSIGILDKHKMDMCWKHFIERSPFIYDARVENLTASHNWHLHGYFQSWKYFHKYGNYLRANFKFRDELIRKAESFFKKNGLTTNTDVRSLNIGIHVRRGDVLSAKRIENGYLDVQPFYYRKAMTYFRQKYSNNRLNFIVASNDMKWCKDNINDTNVYFSTGRSAEEDIVLLTRCDHMIISVGSFGRIIGWYIGGDVIRPVDYPRPGSKFYNQTIMSDLFPEKWIPLK